MPEFGLLGAAIIVGIFLIWFWNSLYIIKEWERGVVLRLGRLLPEAKGAGINLVFWPIETLYRINLRLETRETRNVCLELGVERRLLRRGDSAHRLYASAKRVQCGNARRDICVAPGNDGRERRTCICLDLR